MNVLKSIHLFTIIKHQGFPHPEMRHSRLVMIFLRKPWLTHVDTRLPMESLEDQRPVDTWLVIEDICKLIALGVFVHSRFYVTLHSVSAHRLQVPIWEGGI